MQMSRINSKIRETQKKILGIFSQNPGDFALSGGTALELYYLNHRFSADLDFFSPRFNLSAIDRLIVRLEKGSDTKIKLESEFMAGGRAKVRFYVMPVKYSRPLKIDFVEDVLFGEPRIRIFDKVPVYDIENIYAQKIVAITGTLWKENEIGRQMMGGRREVRDVFDIYMLSKKIRPLHIFLNGLSKQMQRGIVHWYQTFSRQELKLALLDLDIYDAKFDSKEMIIYLEYEIKKFIRKVLE